MTIRILDIYSGNRVDLAHEQATGTDAVIIKGGQGQYQEYRYKKCDFIAQCDALGLPYGIYWQMDARYSPESHKAAIKNSFPDANFGKLGLYLACELPYYPLPDWLYGKMPYAYYKPIESVWRGMKTFSGKYPNIYCSISKWNLIFGKMPAALKQEFADNCMLWQAQYKVIKPDHVGLWPSWTLWQYTENPDYSVFNGDEAQFRALFNLDGAPPVPARTITGMTIDYSDLQSEFLVDVKSVDWTTDGGIQEHRP